VALRGDARHVVAFEETFNNFIYTLGIDFTFGGEEAAAPAPAPAPAPKAPERIATETA